MSAHGQTAAQGGAEPDALLSLTDLVLRFRGQTNDVIDGVSLTVVDSGPGTFSVAIIPYTYEHTRFGEYREGSLVNLEFDMIGKYVARLLKGYET